LGDMCTPMSFTGSAPGSGLMAEPFLDLSGGDLFAGGGPRRRLGGRRR